MASVSTIIFDFGNTLAPFNGPEADGIDGDLARFVSLKRAVDEDAFFRTWRTAREEDFRSSAATGREHDFGDRLARVLSALGTACDPEFAREAERATVESFVRRVSVPEEIRTALRKAAVSFRLAVLSNYLLSEPIRGVLKRDGVNGLFDVVLVSKEVGYAKPHPHPFREILDRLGGSASETLFVGDSYEADVRGALGMGMKVVWTWAMLPARPSVSAESLPAGVRVVESPERYLRFLENPTEIPW